MRTLTFSTTIRASREKVWNVLWEDASYRKWTSVFCEGSYAVSDWHEGSKILFLSPTGEGMHSIIAKKVPNQLMSFKHLGMFKGGKEQPEDEESKKWSGAMESYSLEEKGNVTALTVSVDIVDDHAEYFSNTFPKALETVKKLAEN